MTCSTTCTKSTQQQHLRIMLLWTYRVCGAKRGDYTEPTQGRGRQRRPQRTQQQPDVDSGQKDTYTLFPVQDPSRQPVTLRVLLNDSPVEMEVDTGAAASVISEKTYWALWPKQRRPQLQDTSILLRTYTSEQLKVKGKFQLQLLWWHHYVPEPSGGCEVGHRLWGEIGCIN